MRLFVKLLIAPWLILLSKTPVYQWLQPVSAVLAGIAVLNGIVQRVSDNANFITGYIDLTTQYASCIIVLLAAFALAGYTKTYIVNIKPKLTSSLFVRVSSSRDQFTGLSPKEYLHT